MLEVKKEDRAAFNCSRSKYKQSISESLVFCPCKCLHSSHRIIVIHNILLQNNLLAAVKTHEILRSMQAIAEPYFRNSDT